MQFTVFGVLFWFASLFILRDLPYGAVTQALCTMPAILAIKSVGLERWKENLWTYVLAVFLVLPWLFWASTLEYSYRDGFAEVYPGMDYFSYVSPFLFVGSVFASRRILRWMYKRSGRFSSPLEFDK